MRTVKAALAAGVLSLFAAVAPADVTLDSVMRADTVVKKDVKFILGLAYPSAKDATSGQATWTETTGGYVLDEVVNYTDSDGAAQFFTLRFTIDRAGHIGGMTELTRTEFWPTFATSNLLLAAMQTAAQSSVDTARAANQTPSAVSLMILKAKSVQDVVVGVIDLGR